MQGCGQAQADRLDRLGEQQGWPPGALRAPSVSCCSRSVPPPAIITYPPSPRSDCHWNNCRTATDPPNPPETGQEGADPRPGGERPPHPPGPAPQRAALWARRGKV